MDCTQALASPIMQQIVRVESGGNPYAIGVVGNQLIRQPATLEEAVATAGELLKAGWNFSIGQGQVNKVHFARLGWTADLRKGFEVCANMTAAAEIYEDCHARAVKAGYSSVVQSVVPAVVNTGNYSVYSSVHAALSCYYSGSFVRGAKLGYVSKVLNENKEVRGLNRGRLSTTSSISMMVD